MKFKDMIKQCSSDSKRWFPDSQRLSFTLLALTGELGEACNILKKVMRGTKQMDQVTRMALAEELIDVQVYLCNAMGAEEFKDVDWDDLYRYKRELNEARFAKWKNGAVAS